MNANVFLDTNILVYSYSVNELEKRTIARNLILNNFSFISTQVLQELSNTITRKLGFSFDDAIKVVEEMSKNNNLHTNTKINRFYPQLCGFCIFDKKDDRRIF